VDRATFPARAAPPRKRLAPAAALYPGPQGRRSGVGISSDVLPAALAPRPSLAPANHTACSATVRLTSASPHRVRRTQTRLYPCTTHRRSPTGRDRSSCLGLAGPEPRRRDPRCRASPAPKSGASLRRTPSPGCHPYKARPEAGRACTDRALRSPAAVLAHSSGSCAPTGGPVWTGSRPCRRGAAAQALRPSHCAVPGASR